MSADHERRFGGVARLYGKEGAEKIYRAHVTIVGIGGVGSWTAEALARSGVGELTLIDLDMVAESNTNRQIHALGEVYGQAKVSAMAERIRLINPDCKVNCIEDFVTLENLDAMFANRMDFAVDAIDQTRIKAGMIAHCRKKKIPIIVAGAAGGQFDPTRIQISDLSQTTQDPLLARVRSILRKEYGFTRDTKKKFTIPAIFSTEQLRYPDTDMSCSAENSGPSGLNCAGFGSSVCVTAVFGMAAAAHVLKAISAT